MSATVYLQPSIADKVHSLPLYTQMTPSPPPSPPTAACQAALWELKGFAGAAVLHLPPRPNRA